MKFNRLVLRRMLLVIGIALLVVYSAMRERVPDVYNGIIAGVAIGLLVLNFILIKRKQN
jgi:Kef-type K+ transport system membrane component KefB